MRGVLSQIPQRPLPAIALLLTLLSACRAGPSRKQIPSEDVLGTAVFSHSEAPAFARADKAALASAATHAEDGEWRMPLRDYAGTRYSGLSEITRENVTRLRLVWSYETGLVRGHEATPIVAGSMLFLVLPFPNEVLAFDLMQPEPVVKWRYRPAPEAAAQGAACCDHVNRGAAYAGGRLFFGTLDAHAVALDAVTGTELWKVKLGDFQHGETITMAPLVVGNRVLFGNSGGEYGARGWLAALDVATGSELWRAHSTGPDSEVLIGPSFRPHYEDHRGADLGVRSWPGESWKIGGGTVWGWITYDPALDLIYHGTSNAAPWNPEQRRGDNKWAATVFARRPATGEAVWAYQWDPRNLYDWDGVNESVLLDIPWQGTTRAVLLRAERNGFVYVIDRATGEVLAADEYVHTNAHRSVDVATGIPERDLTKAPHFGRTVHDVCPGVPGAKGAEPMAFSARTGLLYIPANNICADIEARDANYIAGTPYVGATVKLYAGPGGYMGELIAWDPVKRERVWSLKERFLTKSGPLATAGDVLFYGTMDRWFRAVDAWTGRVLWEFETETGIIAPPITYRGPDGRQYVAVVSGPGGWAGSVVSVPIDTRDSTAARGMANAMRQLPQFTGRGGHLYIFALP